MTFQITPYPEFSWSISRQRLLDQCPRAYFCSYYLSHNGWMDEADADARTAYRLKQLCSLDTELGSQMDVRARELEACARGGRALPGASELEERTRAALNACWRSSRRDREDFEWSPKRVTMLRCQYLGQDSGAEIARVEEKLHAAHAALLAVSHWTRLRECGEEGRVEVPNYAHFVLRGLDVGEPPPTGSPSSAGSPGAALTDLKVFAAPDLAYVHDGVVHIIDWKTGRRDDTQELQVKLQAWWLVETHPELAGAELRGYLEYLAVREAADDPGSSTAGTPASSIAGVPVSSTASALAPSTAGVTCRVTLDGAFKDEAARAVRHGVAQMRRLLADPDGNVPLPMHAFKQREGPLCAGCNFSPLCRP